MNKLVVIALCLGLAACSKKKPEEQRDGSNGPVVGSPSTPATAPAPTPAPAPATMTETPAAGSGSAAAAGAGSAKPAQ